MREARVTDGEAEYAKSFLLASNQYNRKKHALSALYLTALYNAHSKIMHDRSLSYTKRTKLMRDVNTAFLRQVKSGLFDDERI